MKKRNEQSLFQPAKVGRLELKNRIVMAPMTRSRAINNTPNNLMADYYAQRSSAGLIITEGTAPSVNGIGYARIPGLFTSQQVNGWQKVTKAVHNNGGKIFTQLMHVGRVAHLLNVPAGGRIIAPSAIKAKSQIWTDQSGMQDMGQPKEMTLTEIEQTVSEFVSSAVNAMEAGFDGVELHGANGYLLEQFLNPHANQRKDEYGGSHINRSRFLLEVVDHVTQAIGPDRVGVRLSPNSTFNDMPQYPEVMQTYSHLAKELNARNIAYLHLIDYAARASAEGQNLIQSIRSSFKPCLIFNGGYDKHRAEHVITVEGADLVSFGSKFISNPDLPYKLANDIELTPADGATFYTPFGEGYTDYPSHHSKTSALAR